MTRFRTRRCLLTAVFAISPVIASLVISPIAGAAVGPKIGGGLVSGGYITNGLDQGAAGFAMNAASGMIFGSLFNPPAKQGGAPTGDFATGYSYDHANTQLKIFIRPGVKFQDGTPLTATAVVWNLDRYANPVTSVAQDFALVKSMRAVGRYTVVIDFTQPTGLLIQDLEGSGGAGASFMGSPTAFNKLGANQFNFNPVGAGPYVVTSDVPTENLVLTRWSGYWDAKHVYLKTLTFINTGTDPTVQLDDLESGAISYTGFNGSTAPASIIYLGDQDSSLNRAVGLNTAVEMDNMNTNIPPFNNMLAREAIAYCTDRVSIANDADQGFATPAFVLAGPNVDYMNGVVKGKDLAGWKFGQALDQFPYDPARAEAIVQQLGGLKFSYTSIIGETTGGALAVAQQQQWTACGMQVTPMAVAKAASVPQTTAGTFQIKITADSVAQNPGTNIAYQTYGGPLDSVAGGFNVPSIYALIAKANASTNLNQQAKLWRQVWVAMDNDVVDMPVTSAPTFYFYSKCVKGLDFTGGTAQTFVHAYLTCSV